MRSLTLIILALTLTFSTMARSYQVARIHGRIIKISGDTVRVQDDKNQIFSVDRNKAYPIGSQIGDDVVIYQKVRFKSSYNENTTSFFIKHRKTPMVKAVRKFLVSYEKKMGFKYKKKKKYTFYDKLQSLFNIDEAHAQASTGDTCYIGGRKSKIIKDNNGDIICEMFADDKYSCGDSDKNDGFRCSPSIFYKKDISKKDNYLNSILYVDDQTKDKGFCVKHDGTNITRRCYNAALKVFGSESKADEFEQRERVIDNLYSNLDKDQEAIANELKAMVADIDQICEEGENALESCSDFIEDIEAIENDLLGWAKDKQDQAEAEELKIRNEEIERITAEVEKFLNEKGVGNSTQGQGNVQQYMINPQGGSVQPVAYQLMLGNQMQAHNPMMAQMAQMGMQQPVVIIIVPNYNPNQTGNNNQGTTQDQLMQQLLDQLRGKNSNQQVNTDDDNQSNNNQTDDNGGKDIKPIISLNTYSYANKLENCKVYEADICLVKQSDQSFKSFKNSNGEYQEFEAAKFSEDGGGIIEVDGESFLIEDLTNTDPSLEWDCEVLPGKVMENNGNSCMASEVSCNVYDEDKTLVAQNRRGYLSKQHAQAFGEEGGSLTYSFNSYTKTSTVSPPLVSKVSTEPGVDQTGKLENTGLAIEGSEPQDFTQDRNPPLFYSPCEDYDEAKDDIKKQVRADNKSCIKDEFSFIAEACEHGDCDPKTITICKTDVSCQVEYKNAFNKLISNQTAKVTLDCNCNRGNPDTVDIASCVDNSQDRIINEIGKKQPGENSSQQ